MAARAPQPDPAARRRGPTGGVVAIVVLVVMCLGWWLFSGNGPAGPDGNAQRLVSPQVTVSGDPSATPTLADVPGTVRIDGFVPEAGNRLALNYTSGAARCVGRLDTPTVLENDAAVTVTLMLVPPASPPRRCPEVTELHTVRIDLDAPLEGRSLLDGSRAQPTRVEQDATANE